MTTASSTDTSSNEQTVADRAGYYERCSDEVGFTILSPDKRWTARRVCNTTELKGPGIQLTRPDGYPVSFSPDSRVFLFVSSGEPISRSDQSGRAYLETPARALYLLRLVQAEAEFGIRLMNLPDAPTTDLIIAPPPRDSDKATDRTWVSSTRFRYTISGTHYAEYDGAFEVDTEQEHPQVHRAH
jgi:hypothetical protein